MRLVPFRVARPTAFLIAWAAWTIGIRKRVLLTNFRLAFPEMHEVAIGRHARSSLRNIVTVLLEIPLLRHQSDRQLRHHISFENLDLVSSPSQNGLLLLSGHVGNWELLALAAGSLSGRPFAIVVKDQSDFGELNRMRASKGNTVIPSSRAVRESMELLASGRSVAMLADQSAAPPDPMCMFMGIPTPFFGTPARLALRYRPRVVVGFALRRRTGGYHVRVEELEYGDLVDSAQGRIDFTQRYVNALQDCIRQHPDQWLWTHRRWKYYPGVTYR